MDLSTKISDLIYNELNYAYCDNCRNVDNDTRCDGCYRKYQNWAVSKDTTSYLAEAILGLVRKENMINASNS